MSDQTTGPTPVAFLEYFSERHKSLRRIKLDPLPFRIGRGTGAHLLIPTHEVSKKHCEISWEGEAFVLSDLGSTNGTFLNGNRTSKTSLKNDDLLNVAHEEFRFLVISELNAVPSELNLTAPVCGDMPSSLLRGNQFLKEMLAEEWGRVLFQPIVDLDTGSVMGFEGLGRGLHENLNVQPAVLFDLADQCGLAVPLSRMFLKKAVRESIQLPPDRHIFLNLHPSEIHTEGLADAIGIILSEIQEPPQFVVEINEKAIFDLSSLRKLREEFQAIGVRVAYDDFGAGQARFLELADLPPDFIKLDMALIRDLHLNGSRQNLVRAITRASEDLGVQVIAEGIETQEEADVCRTLGCHFGQGYLFSPPKAASAINPRKDRTVEIPRRKI